MPPSRQERAVRREVPFQLVHPLAVDVEGSSETADNLWSGFTAAEEPRPWGEEKGFGEIGVAHVEVADGGEGMG